MPENILKFPTDVSNTSTAGLAFYDALKDVLASNSSDPQQNAKIVGAINSGQQLINTVTDLVNDSGLSSGGLAVFGVATSLVAVSADLSILNNDYSQGVTGPNLQRDILTLGIDLFGLAGSTSTAFAVFQPESAEITLPLAFVAVTTGAALQ